MTVQIRIDIIKNITNKEKYIEIIQYMYMKEKENEAWKRGKEY